MAKPSCDHIPPGGFVPLNGETLARDHSKEVRFYQEVLVKAKKSTRPVSRVATMKTLSESYDEVLRLREAVQGAEARLQVSLAQKPGTKSSNEPTPVVAQRIRLR